MRDVYLVMRRHIGALVLVLLAALPVAPASANSAAPSQVSGPEISVLVRSTLMALHQANLTGNYTVLRDLGGMQFQALFSASALADRFRGFRDRQINLGPAVLYDAQLDSDPRLTTDGLLRVVGHFPTAPQQVIFDFTYRFELGGWRIEDLNVGLRHAEATLNRPALQPAPPTGPMDDVPVPQVRPASFQ